MNFKALVTSLVLLGTSSAAMARPSGSISVQGSWSYATSSPVRDHRGPGRVAAPALRQYAPVHFANEHVFRPEPVELSDSLTFANREYRKDVYPITEQPFGKILIQATGGRTFVHEIRVQFTDLSWAVIETNQTLIGDDAMTVPLGTVKPIDRILVYRADGEAARNINATHRGSFMVAAL